MICFDHQLETPGDRFGCRLNGGRHPQEVLTCCGGILHLEIVRHPLWVILWQAYFIEGSSWSLVKYLPAQVAHKAATHALLDDTTHLDVRFLEEILTGKPLWREDDLLWHDHAMPDVEAPPIRILDRVAGGTVQQTRCITQDETWAPDEAGARGAEPPARYPLVEACHIRHSLWLQ